MVKLSRLHHSGPDLRRVCAWKRTNYDIARLQQPSRPCRSNRSRDASVASRRSSSGQQSDHSTARPPPRSASRCAQTSTFVASPGGSIRTTLMRNSSLELRTMVPFLVPVYRHRHLDKGSRPQGALSTPADYNAASSATLVEALFGRFRSAPAAARSPSGQILISKPLNNPRPNLPAAREPPCYGQIGMANATASRWTVKNQIPAGSPENRPNSTDNKIVNTQNGSAPPTRPSPPGRPDLHNRAQVSVVSKTCALVPLTPETPEAEFPRARPSTPESNRQ
jgi:hypothetical protein